MTYKVKSACLGALAAVALAATASAEELPKHHFKGIASFSSSHVYKTMLKPFWEKQIPEASHGQISADITTFDQVGFSGAEVFRMIPLGLFDFVTNVMSYAAGDDARNEVFDLAGVAPDLETLQKIADAYTPVLKDLFEKKYKLRMMGIWPVAPTVIWCNAPVTSLADLKGKKVRGFNRGMSEFLQAVGAIPVSMSFGDLVIGLQRGAVDCAITGPYSGLQAGLAEVTTHIVPLTLGWATVFEGFAIAKWSTLDQGTQALLTKEYAKQQARAYAQIVEQTDDAYRCLQGQKPCNEPGRMQKPLTVTPLSDADKAEAARIVRKAVVSDWAKRCGKDCVAQFNDTVGKAIGLEIQN